MKDSRMVDGKQVVDYWGYNPVSFFAPNTSYAGKPEYNREGNELKTLVRALHDNGIECFLDVVFNHTAEGNEYGPCFSFKGFDNNVYYMLTPDGYYYNFSGCGNTMNWQPSGGAAADRKRPPVLGFCLSCGRLPL